MHELSLCEAIVEDPEPILRSQANRLKEKSAGSFMLEIILGRPRAWPTIIFRRAEFNKDLVWPVGYYIANYRRWFC